MKPIIGITCSWEKDEQLYQLKKAYVQSVEKAGGIPIVLPYLGEESIPRVAELCDGLLFSGGGDLDPVYWRAQPAPQLREIDPARDLFEVQLAGYAFDVGIPSLGICRGCQLFNAAAGGSLIQHIESHVCHEQNAPRHHPIHDILIKEDTLLSKTVHSTALRVNSFHHQAVDEIAPGLLVSAWSADGIIEGIESRDHPFWLGVQWHPECMRDDSSRRLFSALINAASLAVQAGNGRRSY
ncbi:MAG: gamma-glutamyl-gamma-aminobutyrate hydrolase family protein [Syntrophomonadaceae bacterium]